MVVAFLLLMVVFRSLLIPVVASVMNLLSVGAALGIMNAVFEWGWGSSILGISRTGPVEVFIPVIMFSVLFGLSMDYEVFLVSRMQEEWLISHDNHRAVTQGQAETGRVITAAALIMILVFLSFLLGGNIIIQQFGIGLAGAIIIDAFVIRTVLVPALMHLIGPANWWLPKWLAGVLPRVEPRDARHARHDAARAPRAGDLNDGSAHSYCCGRAVPFSRRRPVRGRPGLPTPVTAPRSSLSTASTWRAPGGRTARSLSRIDAPTFSTTEDARRQASGHISRSALVHNGDIPVRHDLESRPRDPPQAHGPVYLTSEGPRLSGGWIAAIPAAP